MSADNYYLIRKHPDGGFAAVMGFESDDYEPTAQSRHLSFPTLSDALNYAYMDWTEYGVRIHPEVTP